MTKTVFGKKYTFYNAKIAVNFQAVLSRNGFETINVEMAHKKPDDSVDWQNSKTSLQLSEVDAFKVMYCILNNKRLCVQSKYHGEANKKSISFEENTKGGCKIELKDSGKLIFFDLSPGQWFYGKLLLTEQVLGKPVSLEDTKKLMYIPINEEEENDIFNSTPLGQSLNQIKETLSELNNKHSN
jgi:hypothetical protein